MVSDVVPVLFFFAVLLDTPHGRSRQVVALFSSRKDADEFARFRVGHYIARCTVEGDVVFE